MDIASTQDPPHMPDSPFLYMNDHFADVELVSGDHSYGKVHKIVLYNRSSSFREILDRDLHAQRLKVPMVWFRFTTSVVEQFLEAIYTKLFSRNDLDDQGFPAAFDTLIDSIYGLRLSLFSSLTLESDKYGIRDFFKKSHLRGATRYLGRQKNEALKEKVPEFEDNASLEFYRSLAPALGTIAWREDNSKVESNEGDGGDKDEGDIKRPRLH
ncbi:hypothetical protein IWZ03DRAFT_415488 [Phyllosticta citriasiana]|uniref:BTB domain-containing protein n=1 Tax=Phyllosticta citriasiana TaxID=595635 RepID=A0ABR1KNE9_9PEZI